MSALRGKSALEALFPSRRAARLAREKEEAIGRGAHGRRFDGSFWSVWDCGHGHYSVGDVERHPGGCLRCALGTPHREPEWRRATRDQARRFVFDLEGPRPSSSVEVF